MTRSLKLNGILLLSSWLFFGLVDGIQFSFAPHNNITVLQSAVYQCTVSEVGHGNTVTVSWNVNGISSASSSWDSYISSVGIVADGAGTHNTTLTISGDPILNETIVTCVAAGIVDGAAYVNTDSDTLYIQGKPDNLSLQCQLSTDTSVHCNWTVPYTIHGVDITGYRVNITNSSGIPQVMIIQQTQYTYSICEYSNISVAAVIGELEGEIDSYTPTTGKDFIINVSSSVLSEKVDGSLYTFITMEDPKLCDNQLPNRIILNDVTDNKVNYNSVNITRDFDKITGVFVDINKGRLNYSLIIEYDNGVNVKSIEIRNINTFNVQDMIISSNDNTTGCVCFNFTYINGLDTQQAFLEYNCTASGTYGSLTVEGDSNCTTITSNHTCTVKAYDIESSNSIYPTPAAVITTVLGRVTMPISSNTSTHTTTTTTLTHTTKSATVPFNTGGNTNTISNAVLGIIIGIIGTVIIIVLVVIIVAVIIYFGKIKSKHNKMPHTLLQPCRNNKYSTLPGHISRSEQKAAGNTTYQYVVDNVVSKIPEKWEEFGRALALTPPKLQEIRENHPNSDRDAFCDVIQEWQTSEIRPFTMDTLQQTLSTIGL